MSASAKTCKSFVVTDNVAAGQKVVVAPVGTTLHPERVTH